VEKSKPQKYGFAKADGFARFAAYDFPKQKISENNLNLI